MKIQNAKLLNFIKGSGLLLTVGLVSLVGGLSAISNSNNDKIISLIVSTRNNPYFATLVASAQNEIKKYPGYNLRVFDSENDEGTQRRNIDLAISLDSKAVIINPNNSSTAASNGVNKLLDLKIPVVAVDRGVDNANVDLTIASNNVQGAKDLALNFKNKINPTLNNNSIFQLKGTSGSQASVDRNKGFREIFNSNIASSQEANFDRQQALNITTNFLTSDTNKNTKVIFAENDEMALGAITAINTDANFRTYVGSWSSFSSGDIYVMGFDGIDDALIAIENDIMYATVIQQPDFMGRVAVEEIFKYFQTNSFTSKTIDSPTVVVTKANVNDYLK